MAEKDLSEKLIEDYADVFADIINVLAFRGEKLLNPSNIVEGRTTSRYKDADKKIREHIRDVVKYDKQKTTLAVIGIENQSRVDKDMVFRVMGYDFTSYKKQIDEDEHPKHPVITLILHFGMSPWDGPKDILSAIDQNLPYAKYFPEIISNLRINVIDVAFIPEETRKQFTSDFRISADYFCAVRENREEELRYHEQEIKHVSEMLDFFAVFGRDKRFKDCKPVIMKEVEKGAVSMCTVMDYAERQGLTKGRQEGRQEGMEMLVANFLKKDNRVKYTVEMLGVSEEMVLEVAKKLGIEVIP